MASRSCIYSSWLEAEWSSVQLLVVDNGLHLWSYYWGPNRLASLRFLVWKGRCPVLLYKLGWKQQLYVQGIRLYAQIFVSVLRNLIYIEQGLNSREECSTCTHLQTFCVTGNLYASPETLCPVTLPHKMVVFYSNLHTHSSSHSYAFQTLYFTPIFSHITSSEIFFLSLCCCWSAKARSLIFVFNYSS